MFNFFDEIKKNLRGLDKFDLSGFHIVNIDGKLLYVEGLTGLVTLSKESVVVKIKNGFLKIDGENLSLEELCEDTIKISGKIVKVEQG